MKHEFSYEGNNLFNSIVFRPDFNDGAKLNLTQSWSLFFTAGQEENALGDNSELGWFFTNLLIAILATSAFGVLFFNFV